MVVLFSVYEQITLREVAYRTRHTGESRLKNIARVPDISVNEDHFISSNELCSFSCVRHGP
jgi:hypothetical protein